MHKHCFGVRMEWVNGRDLRSAHLFFDVIKQKTLLDQPKSCDVGSMQFDPVKGWLNADC